MNSVMSFEGRTKAFETQFALDEEITFKIASKTNTLVAEWAAERLGLESTKAIEFVQGFQNFALENGSQSAFKQKMLADFAANKIDLSENALERLIALKAQIARKQVLNT